MISVKFLILLTFFGLFLLYKDAVGSVTWSYFHSGSPSVKGRLKAIAVPSLSYCAVECFVDPLCEIFGHASETHWCHFHDGDFSTTSTSMRSSIILRYYKAECGEKANYAYIKSLKKCLWYVTDQLEWEEAKAVCEVSGGHLLYVKTQAVLDYLKDQRETSNTKYWVGGTQVRVGTNNYQWLSGEILNMTSGGQFWVQKRPDVEGRTEKICIETKYSNGGDYFGLRDRECNFTRKFFCEMDQF